ncbi:MAG: FkbM family methyltransferase [Victivallaceae bacterium]|nr:FkbM family methyltransferase [Victivallaceae bacterium]
MELKQLIVYGAGNTARALLAAGVRPLVFLDRHRRGELDGIRIAAPEDLHLCCRKNPVLLTVFSPPRECGVARISSDLAKLGYDDITDFESFYQSGLIDFKRSFMWLAPAAYFESRAAEITAARALLADNASRELFDLQIRHRLGEPWTILPPPEPEKNQYFDPSVPLNLPSGFFFADTGAFTGDTLPPDAGRILALEPDPANFEKLRQTAAHHPGRVELVQAAAGEAAGKAGFAAAGSAGCLNGTGMEVEMVRLDDLFSEPPDYAKFDIEGGEAAALAGMARTIARHAPRLAVAVYHRPEDIFAIPLYLHSLRKDYRFHLRCYGEHCMETILYALPDGKN